VPILIDGHNLIGHMPSLSLQDPDDEAKLIALLKSYHARTGKAVTVIFDPGGGHVLPTHRMEGGVEVIFARQGRSADDLILKRVRRSHDPRRWLVVTSDLRLAQLAEKAGARVQGADVFALRLEPPPEEEPEPWKDAPLSPAEVESWLALFEGRD